MTAKKKDRGESISLPAWWLEMANRIASKGSGWTQDGLAQALTNVYGRGTRWDHKTVGNFLKGRHPTAEMMEAFHHLLAPLPRCRFDARSLEEAVRMEAVASEFDTESDRIARRERLDRALMEAEMIAKRQAERVRSRDGKTPHGGGRAGGMGGGRRATGRS